MNYSAPYRAVPHAPSHGHLHSTLQAGWFPAGHHGPSSKEDGVLGEPGCCAQIPLVEGKAKPLCGLGTGRGSGKD